MFSGKSYIMEEAIVGDYSLVKAWKVRQRSVAQYDEPTGRQIREPESQRVSREGHQAMSRCQSDDEYTIPTLLVALTILLLLHHPFPIRAVAAGGHEGQPRLPQHGEELQPRLRQGR